MLNQRHPRILRSSSREYGIPTGNKEVALVHAIPRWSMNCSRANPCQENSAEDSRITLLAFQRRKVRLIHRQPGDRTEWKRGRELRTRYVTSEQTPRTLSKIASIFCLFIVSSPDAFDVLKSGCRVNHRVCRATSLQRTIFCRIIVD